MSFTDYSTSGGSGSSSYVSIGTSVTNGYVTASLSGTLRTYTALLSGSTKKPSSNYYAFSAEELTLTVSRGYYVTSAANQGQFGTLYIYKIEIMLGSTVVRTIDCYGGSIWNAKYDYVYMNSSRESLTIPLNATKKHYGGNPYGYTAVESTNPVSVTTAGSQRIYAKFYYRSNQYTGDTTTTLELGYVYFYPLTLSSISVNANSATRKFYKNATFSSSGKVVTAYYYFGSSFGSNYAGSIDVTSSSSVSGYDTSTVGTQSVTVSYGGKTTSYSIEVVGVSSISENTTNYFRYAIDTSLSTPSTVVVTYTDGTTHTLSSSELSSFQWVSHDSLLTVGSKSCKFSIYDSNTQETVSQTVTKYVRDVTALTLTTAPTTTSYQTNETFDITGAVITATYNEAGTYAFSGSGLSSFTVTAPDMTTAGSKNAIAAYRSKTVNIPITVNGISSVRIYNPGIKILKGDTTTDITSGIHVFYTCTDQEETELSLSSSKVSIDTSSVNRGTNGTYNVYITVTHEGNSITSSYQVTVYSLDSLTLSNYTKTFIYTSSAPTFSAGSLVVTGVFSDGTSRALSSSEYSVSQPDNMDTGYHTVTVTSTIGTTVSATYQINVIDDYPTEIVSVDLSGWTGVFVKGDTFSGEGIIVYAKMAGGNNKKVVAFSTDLDSSVFGTDITTTNTTFTISVDSYDPTNDTATTLTVAYNSELIENSATLTAIYDKLTAISVNSSSAKTDYKAGETISKTGLVVTATYSYSGAVTLPSTSYTLSKTSAFSTSEVGTNTITVSFGGLSATYSVVVWILNSITISSSKTQYNRFEDLDFSLLTLTKIYSDGSNTTSETLSYSSCSFSGRYDNMIPNNNDGLTTSIVASYTEATITKTATLTLTIKALSSVALSSNKVSVLYGSTMSLVGETLTATFNTGDIYSLVINAGNTVTISGTDYSLAISPSDATSYIKNKVENVTIGLTYGGATVYATITIHCIYLSSIVADASYYTGHTLYAGESIDLDNITISKVISSTDAEDTDYPVTTVVDDATFNVSDGYILVEGTNNIQATYTTGSGNTLQTKSVNITLTALAVTLQSISCDSTGLSKSLDDYVEGQSLSLTGLVVSAVFNQTSSNRDLSLTECKVYIDGEERYYTTALTTDDNGKTLEVAYTYNGTTKSATVGTLTVIPKVLSSISIRNTSTHDTTFEIGDYFSTDGLVLLATYNDGYEEVLTSGFATDFDSYKSTRMTNALLGSQTVTVSLTVGEVTQTCTYTITVSVPALASLRFDTSLINLNVTNGSTYSLASLIVYGVFTNGYEEQLTMDADSSYIAGEWFSNVASALNFNANDEVTFNSDNLGVKGITVTGINPYDINNTITGTLNVTVEPNLQLVSIQLFFDEENFDPFNYVVGDAYTGKGMTVKALFVDTDWMEVSGWTTNPSIGTILRSGGRKTITVSYTSQGVVCTQTYVIVVSMAYDSGLVDESTYKVAFNVASVTHDEATIEFSASTQLPLFNANYIAVDTDTESDTYGLNIYTGSDANSQCIGYLKLGSTSEIDGSVIENGQVILFDDPVNPIDGQGNIVVKFPHYVSGYADRINKCHFGIMYNKRLFLAGNPDYPNIDYHSSQVNSSQVENYDIEEDKDLTYFSDLDYCKYGSENSAVVGYDIYRDGTLLVFKEKGQHEATVYTRTSSYNNASSYDGTVVSEGELAEEAYPCYEVNPNGGSGALSPYTVVNFVGETIVLTKDGLKAITSKETTYNNAKYSYDVSSHINNKLLKEVNLDEAYISQFKEKLLLKTDRGLYVGEYKIRDENSEYEWYFCDNIDAYYFFELDDQLYFSDEDGNINRFVESEDSERKDRPRTYIGLGGTTLSIDASNDTLIVSSDYGKEVVKGREFHLLNVISEITGAVTDESQIHATMGRYGTFVNANYRENAISESLASFDQTQYVGVIDEANNELILRPYDSDGEIDMTQMLDDQLYYYDGRRVYIDQIEGTVLNVAVDTPYFLSRVASDTPFDYRYQLLDVLGNVIELSGIISFRLSFRIGELALAYITDVENYGDDGAKTFKVGVPLKYDSSTGENVNVTLDLIYYNNRNGTYKGVITDHENVISYFITKPFNLEHDLYEKTIHMWSIINDTQIASYMDLGYIASRKYADFKVAVKEVGGARQLDFSGLNLDKIHFTNDLLPHIYTRSRIVPRVGFVRFIFSNDEGTRMVLSKLEIIYSYSLLTKGVK